MRKALVLAALPLLACAQPPTKEIAAAEAAIEQARRDEADLYARERFGDAEAALRLARQKVDEKDYRAALKAAMDAGEEAKAASAAVASAKVLAKSAAEMASAEVQAALDEVALVQEEAAKAKVPDEAFAELQPRLDAARQAVTSVAEALEKGDLLLAQKAGGEAKAATASLAADFRAALERWQEEHPKKGRPVKKK